MSDDDEKRFADKSVALAAMVWFWTQAESAEEADAHRELMHACAAHAYQESNGGDFTTALQRIKWVKR